MQATLALVAALASVAYAAPQGVTANIAPSTPAPPGCAASFSGKFEITAFNESAVAKRDLEKRTCDAEGSLTITLVDGKLTDASQRTGYIAANFQFQFDDPPQTGAIFTAGWSVCSNGSLALGGSNIFYQCKSGNPNGGDSGAFFNLYDRKAFDICTPAVINILPCAGSSSPGAAGQQPDGQPTGASASAPPVSQISDGQPQAASAAPPPISQIGDGQIQVPTNMPAPPVSQIGDGQIQAPTGAAISQISDGQVQAPTGAAISQISDGQVQAPTGAAISQISDGQIQAPTATAAPAISQISDGQIQAPTATAAPAISQISDGQIQAPTATAAPAISQISDGQIQAPTGPAISQISDGQIQAPTGTTGPAISQIPDGQIQAPTGSNVTVTPTPTPFLGAASSIKAGLGAVVGAMVLAVALL